MPSGIELNVAGIFNTELLDASHIFRNDDGTLTLINDSLANCDWFKITQTFYDLYFNMCVDFVTKIVSNIEIKQYVGEKVTINDEQRYVPKEIKDNTYHLLNYAPNPNETRAEFIGKVVDALLRGRDVLIFVKADRTQLQFVDSFKMYKDGVFKPNRFDTLKIGEVSLNATVVQGRNGIYIPRLTTNMPQILQRVKANYESLIEINATNIALSNGQQIIVKTDTTESLSADEIVKRQGIFKKILGALTKGEQDVAVITDNQTVEYNSRDKTQGSKSASSEFVELLDKFLIDIAGTFNISVDMLLGKDFKREVFDLFMTAQVLPLVEKLELHLNKYLYSQENLAKGDGIVFDTFGIEYFNIVKSANQVDKLISSGMYTVNEARERLNQPLAPHDEITDTRFITKNFASAKEIGNIATTDTSQTQGGENSNAETN